MSADVPPVQGPVLITGGTGFIGTALATRLLEMGVDVAVLTRDRERARRHFRERVHAVEDLGELGGEGAAAFPEVIVNLAGKNLGSERWNARVKRELVASRVDTTLRVLRYVAETPRRPRLLISGSAVGYYGARGDEPLTEEAPPGDEFQSRLCVQWEQAALEAGRLGVRVCLSRTGVVMGPGGGLLSGLVPLFRKGLGAIVAGGGQWVSWIHIDDLVDRFLRFMREEDLEGAFNNTAPEPVTHREFSRTLGEVLGRPVLLRVPAWVQRLLVGEMARLQVTGQRVVPARHLADGVRYRHPALRSALQAALS